LEIKGRRRVKGEETQKEREGRRQRIKDNAMA